MEEIFELQKKLANVQASSNLSKLSDRIIVDLIDRLLKLTDFRLIFTQDGQEYLTPEHLDFQIHEIIQLKQRVSVIELPQLLNISFEKIESRLDLVLNKYQDLYRLNDFLFTGDYIDSICEQVNEDLQQKMHVPLVDISSKFNFPVEFIKGMLVKKIGGIIQGVSEGGKLTTFSYVQTMRAKIRGVLRGSIRPVPLSSLVKDYDIEEEGLGERIEELLGNEEIEGKVQGGMFVPSRFLKNQELIVKNFFRQNDYIEYSLMTKQLMITKPKDFLKNMFKDSCIFLDNVCFNKDCLSGVKEQVVSLLDFGWVDLQNILPSVLKDEEIETITTKYMGLNDSTEIDGTLLFSKEFLEKCTIALKDRIIDYIYKTPQKLVENKDTSMKPSQNQKSGQTKKFKKNNNDDNDEKASEKLFSKDEVIKVLLEHKLLEISDKDDYLEEKLYKLLLGKIAQLYENIKKDLFETKKAGSAEVIQELQKKIEDLLLALQYHLRSTRLIEASFTNIDTSIFTEASFQCSRFLIENLVILLCKKYGISLPPSLFTTKNNEKQEVVIESITMVALNSNAQIFKNIDLLLNAIDFLPKDLAKLFKEIKEFLLKKKVDELIDYIAKNHENFVIKGSLTLDKKNEKNFFHLQKYFCREAIKINKFDVKNCFFNCLNLFLLEENQFFISRFEDKSIMVLNKTLAEITTDPDNKKLFILGLEGFNRITNKENELQEEYFSYVKEMEGLVENMMKILKV